MSYENPRVLASALLVATALQRMQDETVRSVRHDVLRDFGRYRTRWRRRSINAAALVAVGIGGMVIAHTVVDERRQARSSAVEEITPTD